MRKAIYKAICDRINTANLGVKFCSLWNNNMEKLSNQKAFRLPAIFVEFEPIQWGQLTRAARNADIRVHLHIVTASLVTPEIGGKYIDKALEHLDLIEGISTAISGLSGKGFNAFMLVESISDHDHDAILHYEEIFTTHISDSSATKPLTIITAT